MVNDHFVKEREGEDNGLGFNYTLQFPDTESHLSFTVAPQRWAQHLFMDVEIQGQG